MVWHSKDIVNWKPIARHTFHGYSGIWAIDIQYFNGKYHIYMPVGEWPGKTKEHYRANFVTLAENPEGPWSDPIRVDTAEYIDDDFYTGIDPGFIQTPEGKKYLYVDHGYVMPLDDDGLKMTGMPKVVYDGWKYPEDWVVECKCLESPKLFMKDGFYYLVSAMGGTSGPSTAHMAVVARSKSPTGPWEDSPINPLIKTMSVEEKWWHQGHATIFEGPDGEWWTVYHARDNEYPELGRSTLLMPIEWTDEGWPKIKGDHRSWEILKKPESGENIGHGMPISDDFKSDKIGMQWVVPEDSRDKYRVGEGSLILNGQGKSDKDATKLYVLSTNKSYEVSVNIEIIDSSVGGITFSDDEGFYAGLAFANGEGLKFNGKNVNYNVGEIWRTRFTEYQTKSNSIYLKIRNYKKDLSFFCSEDGNKWIPFRNGVRSGQYLVKLYAAGQGKVKFSDFKYIGLD
jgi:beta-xylosidase